MTTPNQPGLGGRLARAVGRTALKGVKKALLPNPDPETCNGHQMVGSRKRRCGKKLRNGRTTCGSAMCAATTMEG